MRIDARAYASLLAAVAAVACSRHPLPPATDGGADAPVVEASATEVSAAPPADEAAPRDAGPDAGEGGGAPTVDASLDLTSSADGASADAPAAAPCGAPTDPRNCGTCGHDCTTLPHVRADGVACRDGVCSVQPGGCFPGYRHCSSNPDLGCEVDDTLAASCGGCGQKCAPAAPLCATPASGPSACVAACAPGLTMCREPSAPFGPVVQHCVDLQTHRDHCGACDKPCRVFGAEATCVAGQCVFQRCVARAADCDPARPGCETTLGTFYQCRGCGDSCATAHAAGTCTAAGCASACDPGRGDCRKDAPDCETALDSGEHCGACGAACPAERPLCAGPRDRKACVAACDASAPDRCGTSCTSLATDPNHCGACGAACEGYQVCDRGRCTPRYAGTAFFTGNAWPRAVALAPDGASIVAGDLAGEADFDPGPGVDARSPMGAQDAFVTRLGADGRPAWTRVIGAAGADDASALAVAPDGTIVVAGTFEGTVDFDPTAGVEARTARSSDLFVWKLRADGTLAWVRTLSGGPDGRATAADALAVGADGTIVVVGLGLTVTDAGGATPPTPTNNMFALALDATGATRWERVFEGDFRPRATVVAPDGTVWIGGLFQSEADFDPGEGVDRLERPMFGSDSFIERLDASGQHLGVRVVGLPGREWVERLVVAADGAVFASGVGSPPDSGVTFTFLTKRSAASAELWVKQGAALQLQAAAPGGGALVGVAETPGDRTVAGVLSRRIDGEAAPAWTIPAPYATAWIGLTVATDAAHVVHAGRSEPGRDFDPGAGRDVAPASAGFFVSRYDL
jgi:hypothetical protein